MTMVVSVSLLSHDMVSFTTERLSGSRLAVGSSRRRTSQPSASALARESLCCSPPESLLALRLSRPLRPTNSSASPTFWSTSASGRPRILRP